MKALARNIAAGIVGLALGISAGSLLAQIGPNFSSTTSPTGAAGGDLTGTYPNPGVGKIVGVAVTSSPASGILVGTTDTQALTGKTVNGLTITTSTGTLTVGNGKTATVNNTLTFTGTDASSIAFGTGGTAAYTSNNLSAFAATTSAQLAGIISDETGTGALVFAGAPALTGNVTAAGTITVGSGTPATLSTGEQAMAKITASGTAPGVGFMKFEATAGTNAGTCKIIAYAGTSTTPVTVVDNVGTGC